MTFALIMLGGLALDLALGWPDALYARIGHPVTWLGWLIGAAQRRLNIGGRQQRLACGAVATLLIATVGAGMALALQLALPESWTGIAVGAVLAWPMIALRSMHDHVAAVARPLAEGDLPAAREAVSMIVGRDPSRMNSAAVARAATESLAENTSDGIVAPLFWGVALGLPGVYAYKAINTMDSMIGHRTDQLEAFGKTAARLDDLVNWPAARLTGLVFAGVSRRPIQNIRVMLRDARRHRSPNAGWPEAAMAAALGIRLSGPRVYGDHVADDPWLNDGAPDPKPEDLFGALSLYRRAMALCGVVLAILALL